MSKHYKTDAGIEAIDIIDAYNLNFNLGNVVKYTCRSGRKNTDEDIRLSTKRDLEKAKYYLSKELLKYQDI